MGLKSPSDGCWDGRGRTTLMSPCMKKKKDVLTQDTLAEPDLGGSPTADEMMALMDRTPPRAGWTFSGACGSVLGLFGTCGRLQEPQKGPTFCLLDADLAQKGPTSPSEGPDVSLLAHNFDILAFNVTNNVILLSQPCRLF
jgi:hypothetical protein